MTTETIFAVFEDFNEPREQPPAPPVDDAPPSGNDPMEIGKEAWTDGYLTAHRGHQAQNAGETLTGRLLTSLDDLERSAADAVDSTSRAVAEMLVNTVIAAVSDEWPTRLLDRVQSLADQIKPALTVAPEFILRDSTGTQHRFGDISQLSASFAAENTAEEVTIRWRRGEATISRATFLNDLRQAVIPLSAGLISAQQPAGQPS